MTHFRLVFIYIMVLIIHNYTPHLSDYNKILHDFKCQVYSPNLSLKYGLSSIHHVRGVSFCSEYAKRTCCNHTNFDSIRSKWFKMNMYVDELSESCFTALRQLICYDCDSDIGLGVKSGLCARTCQIIYSACIDDYFKFNELNTLGFCEKNSVICSKARDIAENPTDFCKALGFIENANENYEELYEALLTNTTINPVCFNLKPSSAYFGPAQRIQDKSIIRLGLSMLFLIFLLNLL